MKPSRNDIYELLERVDRKLDRIKDILIRRGTDFSDEDASVKAMTEQSSETTKNVVETTSELPPPPQ